MTQKTNPPIAFLPSYVGSKRRWLPELGHLASRPIAELFAGSGIISSTYASRALLVDTDEMLTRALSRFDELIVPDEFTVSDYETVRGAEGWWRYSYYLAAMSRGGIWRWSNKGGFNIQPRNHKTKQLREDYEVALDRWRELQPDVRCDSYANVADPEIEAVGGRTTIAVFDPPYEKTAAQYNRSGFNYPAYWQRVAETSSRFETVIFDTAENLTRAGYEVAATKTMSGIGTKKAGTEGISIVRPRIPLQTLYLVVITAILRALAVR